MAPKLLTLVNLTIDLSIYFLSALVVSHMRFLFSTYPYMDNNNNNDGHERKKGQYHEPINFATQGMSDYAQFSVAIAVGIFGILAIFASINQYNNEDFWKSALWMQKPSIIAIGIVLSIAYWALVLFGIQSYVSRRLFEGVTGNYLKKSNQEWYFNGIKEIARENKLVNLLFKL
jgi:hypothetical protein